MRVSKTVDEFATESDYTLVVTNPSSPRPLKELLDESVSEAPVKVRDVEGVNCDCVALLDEDEIVDVSPMSELREYILLVNSDLYTTGAVTLEDISVPDVLLGMEGSSFRLRGYPESNKQKLILVLISRYIEKLSLHGDADTHRASFQRLSRIISEDGTRSAYEKLASSDVQTHTYGIPDTIPNIEGHLYSMVVGPMTSRRHGSC